VRWSENQGGRTTAAMASATRLPVAIFTLG
jgi:hypothetical protein